MLPRDCEWGTYLLTFEMDHLEMLGFNNDFNPKHLHKLIVDNLKVVEAKDDSEEAEKYGVDHIAFG